MSSRGRKIKTLGNKHAGEGEVFYMSLEEARQAITERWEFLADRYERREPKNKLS